MKTFRHQFKGFGIHPSEVNVHIVNKGLTHYILFEDLSMGTSVTNASEQLATEVVSLEGLDPSQCRFFEYYPQYGSFDEIEYKWKNGEASSPSWKPAEKKHKEIFNL